MCFPGQNSPYYHFYYDYYYYYPFLLSLFMIIILISLGYCAAGINESLSYLINLNIRHFSVDSHSFISVGQFGNNLLLFPCNYKVSNCFSFFFFLFQHIQVFVINKIYLGHHFLLVLVLCIMQRKKSFNLWILGLMNLMTSL